jgi:hypothetical protein
MKYSHHQTKYIRLRTYRHPGTMFGDVTQYGRFLWLYVCSWGMDVQWRLERRKLCECKLLFVFTALGAMFIIDSSTLMKVVGSPKRWSLSNKLHGVTPQNAEYNSDLKCKVSVITKRCGELYQNVHFSSGPFYFLQP